MRTQTQFFQSIGLTVLLLALAGCETVTRMAKLDLVTSATGSTGVTGTTGAGVVLFDSTNWVPQQVSPSTVASEPGSATYNYSLRAIGPQHVVQGKKLIIVLLGQTTLGESENMTYTFENLPFEMTADLPFLRTNCCGTFGWAPQEINTHFQTTSKTPVGVYNVKIVTKSTSGVVKSLIYPIAVEPVLSAVPRKTAPNPVPIPQLTRWREDMATYGRQFCAQEQGPWEGGVWYYDGINTYHNLALYLQDPSYLACADNVKRWYRDQYINPNKGGIPNWRKFTQGLARDYIRTGEPASLEAINYLGNASSYWPYYEYQRETAYNFESRMDSLKLRKIDFESDALLQDQLETVLGHIDQFMITKNTSHLKPFMMGLSIEALIQYYESVQDPRIPHYIKKAMDGLRERAWVASKQAYYYDSVEDASGNSPDLNNLISHGDAWLYQITGDPIYQVRADEAFASGVVNSWLGQGKQFSQNYRRSFDYVKWRTLAPGSESPPRRYGM